MASIEAPEIVFVDSPNAALKELYEIGCGYLDFSVLCDLQHPLINYPYKSSYNTTSIKKRMEVEREILKVVLEQNQNIRTQLKEDLEEEIGLVDEYMMGGIQTDDFLIPGCCFHDFCISVLKLPHNQQKWKAFKNLIKYCGWVFDYKNICIISNRPTSLSFDEQNNLHADGKPAIEYADGFKVYPFFITFVRE